MIETENSTFSPIEMAQLRQALYRFLAMLFLYPDDDRLANVRIAAGELLGARSTWDSFEFGPQVNQLLIALAGLNAEAAEQVKEEYNHLIRVKPVAPPYESFYLDPQGQARGLIASQLEAEYTAAGLALSSSLQDMPDYLTVELEFMSFLCAREVEARETATEANNVKVRIRQRSFLNEHLVRWYPQFARRVTDDAPTSLYSVIAAAAYAFLRHDLAYLGLRKG